jgi:hypothetical protein
MLFELRKQQRGAAAYGQCDISTGSVIELRIPRVAPPRTNSRNRECP